MLLQMCVSDTITTKHDSKVGAGLGLGLRFSRLPGIIKLSEI